MMESKRRRVSTPLSMWSLKNRLVVGVVVLAGLGFIASDIAAGSALHSYLTSQVDSQLASVAGGTSLRLDRAGIAPDENQLPENSETAPESVESDQAKRSRPKPATPLTLRPLRQVPTSMSVTLLNPTGDIVGVLGETSTLKRSPNS